VYRTKKHLHLERLSNQVILILRIQTQRLIEHQRRRRKCDAQT
jgi:hypothetical protein